VVVVMIGVAAERIAAIQSPHAGTTEEHRSS